MIGKFYLVALGSEEPRYQSTKRFATEEHARRYIVTYAKGQGVIIEAEEIAEVKPEDQCTTK